MRKVAVIGMGHVGATAAFILFTHGVADELVLLDKNETKCRAEWGDLRDTLAIHPTSAEEFVTLRQISRT